MLRMDLNEISSKCNVFHIIITRVDWLKHMGNGNTYKYILHSFSYFYDCLDFHQKLNESV